MSLPRLIAGEPTEYFKCPIFVSYLSWMLLVDKSLKLYILSWVDASMITII